ncbi:hypothetical protein BWZ22_12705 [Seonamhaeicola sp. S2-3]|uniref:hypothetical protein n=1 Tax=Seonamhaeicola sp. S2-3 TaxID=1936081 RepID=UPI0009728C74|nr:hypothetical protein [Seonamhaeicola sp. S2-3]APY12035.1 hypothetical protein BWZ22_12705 [Seonamhaeicola sp. S2-3]
MNKNWLYIGVLLFMFFFLGSFYIYSLEEYKNVSQKQNDEIVELKSRVLLQSKYSGFFKFPDNYVLQSIEGNSKLVEDVFYDLTIVLYISSRFCDSCIEDSLAKIKNSGKKYIIVSNGFSLRELKLIKKEKEISAPMYSIMNNNISFYRNMENASYPYYFTIDEDLEVSNVFFPIKSSTNLEDRYFKQINNID